MMRMTALLCVGVRGSSWVLICESDKRVKRKPLVNRYKPIAWITNTQTRTIKLFIKAAGKNGEDRHGVYSPWKVQ
jgi:hypothetical protein